MKTKFKFLIFVIQMAILTPAFAAEKCESLKSDFSKLYIALQDSLNYEGKDAVLQGKSLKLQAHDSFKNGKYEGKLFQDMLYKQYQNSLKKVAALVLKIGKNQNTTVEYNQEAIVDFFKSIDKTSYENADISTLLNKIEEKGKEIFKDPADKMKVLNENDKYLLSKLLIHAKDKICSVEKNSTKNKKNQALNELQQYPLNRMVYALRNASLKGNQSVSDIKNTDDITGDKIKTSAAKVENGKVVEIVDSEKTIQSAVMDNLHALESWLKAHESCRSFFIKSKASFVQGGIQGCNYNKFINSLNSSTSDFEKILHFINANQKSRLKAETGLDPLVLEQYIDSAITAGSHPSCEKLGDSYFVRNLAYDGKSFDPKSNKFECTVGNSPVDCNKSIKLISDDLGRGIKVIPSVKNVRFKINQSESNCNELMTLAESDSSGKDSSGKDTSGKRTTPDGGNSGGGSSKDKDKDKGKDSKPNGSDTSTDGKGGKSNGDSTTPDGNKGNPNGDSTPGGKDDKPISDNSGKGGKGQSPDGLKLTPEELQFKNDCEKNKGKIKDGKCQIGNDLLSPDQLKFKTECSEMKGTMKDGKCQIGNDKLTIEELHLKKDCESIKGTVKDGKCETPDGVLTPEQLKSKIACDKVQGNFKDGKCDKPTDVLTPEQQKIKDQCDKDKGTYKDGKCEPKDGRSQEEKDKDAKAAEEKKACEDYGMIYLPNGSEENPTERCVTKRNNGSSSKSSGGDSDSPSDPFKDFLNGIGSQTGSKGSQRFVPQQIPTRPTFVTPGLQ